MKDSRILNLGCGRVIQDEACNVDQYPGEGVDLVTNFECDRLGVADDSIETFYACHVLEHIRNILSLMQECWRIAAPGAVMHIRCPFAASNDAFDDPTHVRQFTETSWGAYSQPYYHRAVYRTIWNEEYSADWQCNHVVLLVPETNEQAVHRVLAECRSLRNQVIEMQTMLVAVKPARPRKSELLEPYPVHIQMVQVP